MPGQPVAPRTARIIHVTLVVGAALAVLVLAWVRSLDMRVSLDAAAGRVLRYVGLAFLVGNVVVAQAFRARIPPLPAGADEGQWWSAHLPRVMVVWALTESVGLTNGIFYFLTGDVVLLTFAGLGLVLLWLARPSRLIEA